ncbi:MAG: right-handed parallel beta-helix repeat-containing protein [Candidatus Thermoplasmatota archaeon]|nr:right-handed parallel beta-helix repeat-containing protein [Candidatus Thermoplasmatota archaeon]
MKIESQNMKYIALTIVLLLLGTSIIPASSQKIDVFSVSASAGTWLYVGGNGPGNYTKIQDAIDDANDGDTVFVYNGSYIETLEINKSIAVIGEDKDTTFILGGNDSEIVQLKEASIMLNGFTIQRYNDTNAIGIMLIDCWSCDISRNVVKSCYVGILVTQTESSHVSNNSVLDCSFGIVNVIAGNVSITYNRIDGNKKGSGIEVQGTIFRNYIRRNIITNNSIGINLFFAFFTNIQQNNFFDNQQHAFFTSAFFSVWRENYWNQSRLLPKLIRGQVGGMVIQRKIPLFNFDWRPAQEPFDTF